MTILTYLAAEVNPHVQIMSQNEDTPMLQGASDSIYCLLSHHSNIPNSCVKKVSFLVHSSTSS